MRGPVRTALSVLGRTGWAVVVVVVGAAVVVGATRVPGEEPAPVAPLTVGAPPAASVLTCPGPLRLATEQDGADVTYDPAFDPSPVDATSDLVAVTAMHTPRADGAADTIGAGPAAVTALAGGAPLAELAAGVEAGVLVRPGGDAGLLVRADPVGDVPPWASAGVAWRAGTGDLRGLAAASCQRPAARTWLVGGSTELGSSARLVVQNPGATPATVTLRMWGAGGPVDLAGAPDFLVGPGEEEMVLLEGIAAEQGQMVVEVTSTGGLVSAYLQDSRTDGLTAAGVELVVAGAGPATELMVPAISVTDGDPQAASLRVLAPESDATDATDAADTTDAPDSDAAAVPGGTVHVRLLGPDGVVELPGTEDVSVDVGAVVDIPLDGLPEGDYTAWVTADVPVVAGASVTRAGRVTDGERPVERAWSPALAGGVEAPLALPGSEPGRLVVAAVPTGDRGTADASVEVEALDAAGSVLARREVPVPVEGTVSLDLTELSVRVDDGATGTGVTATGPRPAAIVVRTDDPRIVWAVVLDTGQTVGVLAPLVQQSAQPLIAVVLR